MEYSTADSGLGQRPAQSLRSLVYLALSSSGMLGTHPAKEVSLAILQVTATYSAFKDPDN